MAAVEAQIGSGERLTVATEVGMTEARVAMLLYTFAYMLYRRLETKMKRSPDRRDVANRPFHASYCLCAGATTCTVMVMALRLTAGAK